MKKRRRQEGIVYWVLVRIGPDVKVAPTSAVLALRGPGFGTLGRHEGRAREEIFAGTRQASLSTSVAIKITILVFSSSAGLDLLLN